MKREKERERKRKEEEEILFSLLEYEWT